MNRLLAEDDSTKIMTELSEQKISNPRRFKNSFNKTINHYLTKPALSEALAVWELAESDQREVTNSSDGVLAIQTLLLSDALEDALGLYVRLVSAGQTRKRHLNLLIDYLVKQDKYEEAAELYRTYVLTHYLMDSDDLVTFMTAPEEIRRSVIATMVNQPISLPESCVPTTLATQIKKATECPLKLIDFSPAELQTLRKILAVAFKEKGRSTEMESYLEFLAAQPVTDSRKTYVIDGANLMFYGRRKIDFSSYKKLNLAVEQLLKRAERVYVILHQRHFNLKRLRVKSPELKQIQEFIAGWDSNSQVVVYRTPPGLNDDWYSIMAAHQTGAYLLTNDQFRDHVFKLSKKDYNLDLMAQWRKERAVEYEFRRGDIVVDFKHPLPWSPRIQQTEEHFYIPLDSGEWLEL